VVEDVTEMRRQALAGTPAAATAVGSGAPSAQDLCHNPSVSGPQLQAALTTTCADSTFTPLVIVQACRSCTSITPWVPAPQPPSRS